MNKYFKQSDLSYKSRLYKFYNLFLIKFIKFIIIALGLIGLMYAIIYYLNILHKSNFFLAISFILFASSLVQITFEIYFRNNIVNHAPKHNLIEVFNKIKLGVELNLVDYLSINSYLALKNAFETPEKINTNKLLLNLAQNRKIRFIISRMGMSPDNFSKQVIQIGESSKSILSLNKILESALESAVAQQHKYIETGDIFYVLAVTDDFLKELIFNLDVKPQDLALIIKWETTIQNNLKDRKYNPNNLKLTGGIGRDWAAGYTLSLSRYAYDLSKSVSINFPYQYNAHQTEITEIENILSKSTHHNVLLIGEPGVGKEAAVLFLAKKIFEGRSRDVLNNKKLMQLNVEYLLAGAKTSGEILQRLTSVMQDAVYAGNIIIYIDGIHKLFGSSEQKIGAIDASEILLPFFENPNLFIISTTTLAKYHQVIEAKKTTAEKIDTIKITEPNITKTLQILQENAPYLEYRHKVLVTYKALDTVINLSDKFIYDRAYPEKAIMLLEEACSTAPNNSLVTEDFITKLVTKKTGVPIGNIASQEKQKLLNLENILHQRVVGQDEAVKEISNALRRARAGIKSSQKPIGSFLFLGPTGVGKTETAKALAEAYFGNENKIIRFDMSEYQEISSINRFLGAPAGTPTAEAGGDLTNAVKDNPFSLILFDEIEKAHPNILNLFLQLLDEGWITDSLGRKIKFSNSIIIATSNAGAEFIREKIKNEITAEKLKNDLIDYLQQEKLFKPEFINRFTAVISFKPLTPEEIYKITRLIINSLIKNILEEKEIAISVSEDAIKYLAEIGYDPTLGARPIKRTIQNKIENLIAEKILHEQISRGSKLKFTRTDIENNN